MAHDPILWLTLTIGAYAAGVTLQRLCGRHPALNPTLIAIAIVATALLLLHADYPSYSWPRSRSTAARAGCGGPRRPPVPPHHPGVRTGGITGCGPACWFHHRDRQQCDRRLVPWSATR